VKIRVTVKEPPMVHRISFKAIAIRQVEHRTNLVCLLEDSGTFINNNNNLIKLNHAFLRSLIHSLTANSNFSFVLVRSIWSRVPLYSVTSFKVPSGCLLK
jgi:hypothetical protein